MLLVRLNVIYRVRIFIILAGAYGNNISQFAGRVAGGL